MKNRENVIVIGNGFDLNLGLKTSYNDFIESDFFTSIVKENNSLATYLIGKAQLNKWVDIENEITRYSVEVKDETVNVKKDFESLKVALMHYLREAQKAEIDEKSKAFEMMKNELESANTIYNFNYTDSIFKVARILNIDIKDKHFYVHGSLENSNIILGVQDNSGINPKHIFFDKAYNRNFGKSNIIKSLNNHCNLVLFGHSLGITDSSYFSHYISSLAALTKNCILKFYHYGDTGYDEMMISLKNYTHQNLTKFKFNNIFTEIDSS